MICTIVNLEGAPPAARMRISGDASHLRGLSGWDVALRREN